MQTATVVLLAILGFTVFPAISQEVMPPSDPAISPVDPLSVEAVESAETAPEMETSNGVGADDGVSIPVAESEKPETGEAPPESEEPPKKKEMPRVIMARVGDKEITVEEFMGFISKRTELVRPATTQEGKAKIVRMMIENRLVQHAMEQEDLITDKSSPEDIRIAYMRLGKKHFPVPPIASDEDLFAFYEEHKARFGVPERVRISQIQFRAENPDDPESKAAARERAEAALKRLQEGADFAELAAEITDNDRAKVTKGDLGFQARGAYPWLDQAIAGVEVGQYSNIAESAVGFEILKITDRREATITPFANIRDQIAKQYQRREQYLTRSAYIKKLADEVGVTIVQDGLEGAMP